VSGYTPAKKLPTTEGESRKRKDISRMAYFRGKQCRGGRKGWLIQENVTLLSSYRENLGASMVVEAEYDTKRTGTPPKKQLKKRVTPG